MLGGVFLIQYAESRLFTPRQKSYPVAHGRRLLCAFQKVRCGSVSSVVASIRSALSPVPRGVGSEAAPSGAAFAD